MLFSISTFTKAQNNALHFDGINDNVFATMNSIGQEDFTIECWFNQDALIDIDKGIMSIVKTGLEGDLSVVNLAINNGQIVYYIKPSNTVADFWFQTGEFIEPGICYHLAFVKEGSGLKMYLNGQLIDNRPNLFTPQFELGPFITIGNLNTFSTDYFWNGQLDEVRIWQESRSANEIMSTMNLPLMGNESGLLFYADFDQGIPNGNNPAIVFLNEKVTPLTFGTLNNFSLNGPSSNWVESCVILSELCIDDCCPLGSTNDFQDLPVGPLTSSITSQNPTWYAHSGTMDVVSPGCQDPNSILIHPATQVVQPVLALTGGSGIAGPVPLFLKDKYYCFEVCAKIEFSTAYGFVYLSHPNGTIAQSDILFDGEGWVNLDFPIWQADADYYNLHLTVYGANTINSLVVPLNIDNVCITEVSEPAVCKSDFTYELLDCGQVCLTDMSCAENYTRTWTRNGATFSSAETACSTVSNSGTYEFCLSIESPNCSDTYCESIEVIIQGDPPVVICPADNTIETTNVDCKVEGILDDPSVDLDDCAFSSETICIRSDGLPLSDLYCEGITTINCVVTDDLNNSASCSYTIEVVCTPDPIFELCGQAVVTCFSGVDGTSGNFRIPNPNGPVLGLLNVRDRSGVNVGTNWTAASAGHYHHNSWTAQNLGEIFGIALDDSGNIYVTNSTVYGSHPFGPLGGGGIYKVNASSGAITNLVALPNGNDPSQGPGLGNICYSPLYDLLYATNFHDGLIYIVDPNTGNIISTFDPFLVSAPDPTINYSFAPLGDRPWGIGINPSEPDKLYFGNWVESIKAFDGIVNQIYSVSLNSLGLPVGVEQLEVDVSEFISRDRSAPCSDIAFSQDNKMLIAQRSMEGNIIPDFILIWAHESYIAEYERATVSPFDWVISNGNISPYQNGFHNKFRVGDYRDGGNSAGGVDYGYESFTTGLPMICDAMVWATGDALSPSHANANSAEPWIYGLQGLSSTGGTVNNSYLIDFNNNVISWDKTQIGDVEIFKCFSCNADTTDCDLLSIEYVALNDEDETTCCYSANVTNNFGIELNKICIDLTNTPEWIINTGSLSSGYSWDFVSSYKLCIENANGFPVGTSNDVFSYCLSEINNAVMPADTQCVVTSWFIDDLQTQCQDTIKFECGEIQGDTCMVISNIMTMCNPENDYSYCICFDVTNNSGQDAANLKLENLSTGFVFVNGCGGTGFPLGGNTHLYDFYEADGVTPAFKDGTTENLCVNIIANTIISNNTNVSFQASLYNDEACCSEPEIIELQVDPCCDPCSEINTVVIANDDTSTDSTCCYLLSIESSCSYQYFSKVQIDIVTPGIGFGYFGNASPIDWDMVGNDQSITMTPSLAGSIPQGISNILDFCLTDVDEPSEVPQQIRIQYYTLDPALDEIVACDTLIELNCPLSKNACAFVFNEQIECDVDNQKYNITVDVKNLSNPDFAATELLVTPGSIAQYVNPWTFQLTPPLTNDNSSRTVSFCYEPPVFPDPDGLLPIKWFLHNATKDSCCAGHELLFDTLYLPPCLPPCEIVCPDDLTVNCCGPVTLPTPTLEGDCTSATFSCVRADGLALTDPFDIGATCITCELDGAMESCTYCVTVIDTPPVLSCPIDVTILEGDSILPDVLGEASVEDDCSNLTATYEDNITNNGVCPYVIERVWKANDGCNEEVTCTQFIQVQCSAQCELICPDDLTVNCCGPVTLPSPTFGSACQGSVVCVRADGLSLTDPFDEGITCITCELAAEMLSCTYCVTVVDMPPMITCPIDVTIVEGDVTLPIALGEALVEDDCSSVTATYMDNITNNGICPYDIEREWKAIDDCGQEVACVQHIKIDCEMMSCPQCFSDLTYDPVCIDLDGTVDITWNNLCLDQTIGITLINCTTGTVVGNSVITTQNTGSYLWQNPIPNLTPGMYQLYVECIAGNWWQYGTCFEIGECDTTCCVDFEAPIVLNASDDPTNPLIEVDYVDVDGDAYLDQVYFTQLSPNGNTLAWRKNMQNSKFDVAQPVLPNVPWLAKRLPYNYDINSDNYEELFIVNFSTGELEYIEASSIGLDFTTINPLGINIGADGFYAIGDLNNDGCPDLVLRSGVDRDVYFYEGSCNPIVSSFNRINTPLLTITPDNGEFPVPEIYDGDCDGDEDLYFGLSGEIRMYENLGTSVGVGSLPDINLAYLSNVHNVTGISNTTEFVIPRFVDVDNDGDKDLFIDDQSQLQYYENNCDPVLPCTCPTVQEQVVSFEGLESTINCGATFMLPENVTSDIVVSGDFDCSSSCTNGQISWQIASAIGLQTGTSNTGSYSITLSSAWFSKSGSYTFVLNGSCDMESCNSCSITFEVPSTICVCNDFSNVQMTTQNNIYDLDCGLDEFRNLLECPQIDPIIAIDGQVGCAGGCMMSVLNWELRRNGVLYVYNGTSLDNQMTGVDAFGNYQIDLSTVDYWEPGNYRIAAVGFCDATTKCECNHEWIVEDDCDCNCNDFNNIDPILIQDFFNSNSCTIQFHFDNVGPCDVIEWTWQVVGVPLTAISKTTIGSAPVQFTGLDDTAYLLSAQIVRTPVDQNACSRNFSNVYILNCGSTTGGSGDLSFIHDGLVHEGVADYNLEVDENNDVVNVSAINDLEAYGLDVKLGQTKGFGYTHNSWIENVNENDRQFTARYYGSRNGIENSLLRVNQEEIVFMDGEPYVRWVVDNSTLGVINNQLIITDPTDGIIADLTLGNGEPLYFKSNGGTDIYVPETNTEFISSRSNEDNITVMLPNNDLIEVPAGSTMKISAINPQGVVDFFSLVEMRWIGSGTDALFNEHVIMFEDMVSNHAMGNMLFAANNSGNQLDLLNISDGDEEDLLVRWPYCSGVSTNGVTHENIWESKLLKNFNNDASMRINLIGDIEEEGDRTLSTIDITSSTDGFYQIDPFVNLPSSTMVTHQFYQDGSLVDEWTGSLAETALRSDGFPISSTGYGDNLNSVFTVGLGFEPGAILSLNGNEFVADAYRAALEIDNNKYKIRHCTYSMKNVDSMTMLDENCEVDIIDNIEEKLDSPLGIKIYPNPNSGNFNIEFDEILSDNVLMTLTNVMGQKVHHQLLTHYERAFTVDLNDLESGVYILSLKTKNGLRFTTKIIKI